MTRMFVVSGQAKPVQMVSPRVQTPTTSTPTALSPHPPTKQVSPMVAHVQKVIDRIASSLGPGEPPEKRSGGPREVVGSPPALIPDEHPPPQQQPLQLTNKPQGGPTPPVTPISSPQIVTIAPRSTPETVGHPGPPPPLVGSNYTRPQGAPILNITPAHSGGIPTHATPTARGQQHVAGTPPRPPYGLQQQRGQHPTYPIIPQPTYPPGQPPRFPVSTQPLKRPAPVSAPLPQYNTYEPPAKAPRGPGVGIGSEAQDRMRILQESREMYGPPRVPSAPGRPVSAEELELKRLEERFRYAQEEYSRSQEKAKRDKLELMEKKSQMAEILRKMNQIKEHEGTKVAREAYRRIHGVLPPSATPAQAPGAAQQYPSTAPPPLVSQPQVPSHAVNIVPHVIEIVPNGNVSPPTPVQTTPPILTPPTVTPPIQPQHLQPQQPQPQNMQPHALAPRRPSSGHSVMVGGAVDNRRMAPGSSVQAQKPGSASGSAAGERVPRPAHMKLKPPVPVSRMTVQRPPPPAHKKPRIHIKALLMRPILNPRKHRMYGEISPWTQRQNAVGPPSSIGPHHVIKATSLKDHPPIRPPMPAHYRPKKKNERVAIGPPPMAHSNGPYYAKSYQRRASGGAGGALGQQRAVTSGGLRKMTPAQGLAQQQPQPGGTGGYPAQNMVRVAGGGPGVYPRSGLLRPDVGPVSSAYLPPGMPTGPPRLHQAFPGTHRAAVPGVMPGARPMMGGVGPIQRPVALQGARPSGMGVVAPPARQDPHQYQQQHHVQQQQLHLQQQQQQRQHHASGMRPQYPIVSRAGFHSGVVQRAARPVGPVAGGVPRFPAPLSHPPRQHAPPPSSPQAVLPPGTSPLTGRPRPPSSASPRGPSPPTSTPGRPTPPAPRQTPPTTASPSGAESADRIRRQRH